MVSGVLRRGFFPLRFQSRSKNVNATNYDYESAPIISVIIFDRMEIGPQCWASNSKDA